MHEVLFRGKEVADGKWIEGFYSAEEYNPYSGEVEHIPRIQIIGKCVSLGVIPETVGQYTGLTDKNGVRIFEGDICRFKRFNDICVGKIIFNVTTASFVMWSQSIVGAYGEKATHKMLLSVCDDIEVIGNIHDNPELLKGGEDNG